MNSRLLAAVLARSLGLKVILVSLASSIPEGTAIAGCLFEVPTFKVTIAGTFFHRLGANRQGLTSSARALTLLPRWELVVVTKATTINELLTLLAAIVKVPHRLVALAWSLHLRQKTDVLTSRLLAHCLALFVRIEAVGVSFLTAVPEPRTRSVLFIVEVLDRVVLSRSTVLLKTACLLW